MTDGTTTWSYVYDGNGMRVSRSNGTKTYNYVYNGSQLTQMTVGNDTLYFTYGILGPTTVTWNGTTYYYALNAQGDVLGIYDEYGDLVVVYNWDTAWGNNPAPQGSMASTLGALNPLRYRGYVYDTETGYYYLQSRYYDPEIGRFINADALISTGQGFLGNNMFAYCLNNPVVLSDSSGSLPFLATKLGTMMLYGSSGWENYGGGLSGGGSSGGGITSIYQKIKKIVNNTNITVTQQNFNLYGVAFYKGTLVLKADLLGENSGLSFGFIVLDKELENADQEFFSETINHEYGHIVHFQQIGLPTYAVTTAIPSVVCAGLSYIFPTVNENYFNLPWERVADYLGGVNRGYGPGANTWGSLFWLYTFMISGCVNGGGLP